MSLTKSASDRAPRRLCGLPRLAAFRSVGSTATVSCNWDTALNHTHSHGRNRSYRCHCRIDRPEQRPDAFAASGSGCARAQRASGYQRESAWLAAQEIGVAVVVKPQFGNQGRGVITNLSTREQVVAAYKASCRRKRFDSGRAVSRATTIEFW